MLYLCSPIHYFDMKHLQHILASVLCLLAAVWCVVPSAKAQYSCETAVPTGSTFSTVITSPGSYWFSAWTYDLPLRVVYAPSDPNSLAIPHAEIDFTCTPGVYDDPTLEELFTDKGGSRIVMPATLDFNREPDGNGGYVFTLSVPESYRDLMGVVGITNEIQGFVKVTFTEVGNVSIAPDTTFRDCVNNAEYVHLNDTLVVLPNDTNKVFIMPFAEWQEDSVEFYWEARGSDSVTIWMAGGDCHFRQDGGDPNVWDYYGIRDNKTHKLTQTYIQTAVEDNGNGGQFYSKIITPGAGRLIVRPAPEYVPDAKMLEYGKQEYLARNDSNQLYAFKATQWTSATSFTAQAADTVRMYVSSASDFRLSAGDPHVVGVYTFVREDNGDKMCYWSNDEMQRLTAASTDNFLYIRLVSTSAVTFTPNVWDASDCAAKSQAIVLGQPMEIAARSSNTIYRLRYADVKGGAVTVSWDGSSTCPTYIADTCVFNLTTTNAHLVKDGYMNVPRRGSLTRDSASVAQWATKVDADGFLFVRFNPSSASNVTITVSRTVPEITPTDPEPEAPTDPVDPTPGPNPGDDPTPGPDVNPVTPVVPVGSTIGMACEDTHVQITVTEEQDLKLYDNFGNLLEAWHQAPSDVPHVITPTCGVQYVLRGKTNTFKIVR